MKKGGKWMIFQLEATRKELLTLIDTIPEHLFNKKESEQRWSIGQVLDHLHKTEIEITKVIKYILTLPEQEPLKDKPLALTLDRTRKITAPTTLSPSTSDLSKHKLLTSLSQSRKELIQVIESIPPTVDLTRLGYKHPAFDELSLIQWIEFIGYHEKRHLAQLDEIKASVAKESV